MQRRRRLKPIRKAKGTAITWSGPKPVKPPRRRELVPVWKDPSLGEAIKNRPRPAAYRPPPGLPPALSRSLIPGGAVIAKFDLATAEVGTYPLPVLQPLWGQLLDDYSAPIPKGSLLMYAGTVRAVERTWLNDHPLDVQVFKHTFITPRGRCIVNDLTLLGPA